jgi:hypothetical protein
MIQAGDIMDEKNEVAIKIMNKYHELKTIRIDKTNIGLFSQMRNARIINRMQVTRLVKQIKKEGHFFTPLIVNRTVTNGIKKFVLIDGHHRIEAITTMIKENNNFHIDVDFQIWDNLTEEEMRILFDPVNKGMPVNETMWIYVHQDEIPIAKKLIKEKFPIILDFGQIRKEKNKPWISITTLLRAYSSALNHRVYGNQHTNADHELFKALDISADYTVLLKFANDFKEMGDGLFGRKTIFSGRTDAMIVRLWYLNCIERPFYGTEEESRKKFIERFKDAVMHWPNLAIELREAKGASYGSYILMKVEFDLVKTMNYNRKSQRLVTTYEAWKLGNLQMEAVA